MPGRQYAIEQGEFAQKEYGSKLKGKAFSSALAAALAPEKILTPESEEKED